MDYIYKTKELQVVVVVIVAAVVLVLFVVVVVIVVEVVVVVVVVVVGGGVVVVAAAAAVAVAFKKPRPGQLLPVSDSFHMFLSSACMGIVGSFGMFVALLFVRNMKRCRV